MVFTGSKQAQPVPFAAAVFFPKSYVTSSLDTLECSFVVFQVWLPSSGQASSIIPSSLFLGNRTIQLLGWDQSLWNLLGDSHWCQGALELTLHLCQALVSSPKWVICVTLYSFHVSWAIAWSQKTEQDVWQCQPFDLYLTLVAKAPGDSIPPTYCDFKSGAVK